MRIFEANTPKWGRPEGDWSRSVGKFVLRGARVSVNEAASAETKSAWFRRRWLLVALVAIGLAVAARVVYAYASFPSDRTPQGAYLRVAIAVNRGRPEDFFAYTET